MTDSASYLVCPICGTQHATPDRSALPSCFICDDPRQYTPPSGQTFTTLSDLRNSGTYRNEFLPVDLSDSDSSNRNLNNPSGSSGTTGSSCLTSIVTKPKFAIGQRAILVRTPRGNVLWDCVTYLDEATAAEIQGLGGLKAMVISHPHFYSAHLEWAERFDCPVYLSAEDKEWLARRSDKRQVFLDQTENRIEIDGQDSGVRAIKLGGHFPGSLVLLYEGHLLTADTLHMTPSGLANWNIDALGRPRERPKGVNTFCFMWSIPNQIPLSPSEMARMWGILRNYDLKSAHGVFVGSDIEDGRIKERVLESMQIQTRAMGYAEHPLLFEVV